MTDSLGASLSLLLADATSEAKRRGHAVVTPLHLIAVLQRDQPATVGEVISAPALAQVETRLRALPRTFETPQPDGDVTALLTAAAQEQDVIRGLCTGLRGWLDRPADPAGAVPGAPAAAEPAAAAGAVSGAVPADAPGGATAGEPLTRAEPAPGGAAASGSVADALGTTAAGASPEPVHPAATDPMPASPAGQEKAQPMTGSAEGQGFSLPDRFRDVARVVEPRTGLIARDAVADEVLAAIGARSPSFGIVVGAEGSGRSAFAECLARRLSDPGYDGPLAGRPVVLARAEGFITGGRGSAVLDLVRACEQKAVLVLDDLEVLLGLGSGGSDLAMIAVLRTLHGDPGRHVVATLSASFRDRFATTDRELADEVIVVDLPQLAPEQVAEIAVQAGVTLGGYHRVTVPGDVIAAACGAPGEQDRSVHPGLAVARLDRACAAASARPDRTVTVADIPHPGSASAAAVFDAAQALSRLTSEVVGQEEALDRVVRRLRVTRTGLDMRPERPDGVFLFAGPTGTGKTATALALAKAVYGDPSALIRLDMSEFVEDHTVSNLIGSPPGYVGSTEPEGWLTSRIRKRPDVVLLLDEIEKAHPLVWNTFLQVFDAGRLTDRQGNTADFSRTVIVLTTNIGAGAFTQAQGPGFVAQGGSEALEEKEVLRSIKQRMAPELVNRLDDVLVFRPLGPEVIRTIAERQLEAAAGRLAPRGWVVEIDPSAIDLLVRKGFSREYGARPLQREIELRFLEPLVSQGPGRYRAVAAADGESLVFSPIAGTE